MSARLYRPAIRFGVSSTSLPEDPVHWLRSDCKFRYVLSVQGMAWSVASPSPGPWLNRTWVAYAAGVMLTSAAVPEEALAARSSGRVGGSSFSSARSSRPRCRTLRRPCSRREPGGFAEGLAGGVDGDGDGDSSVSRRLKSVLERHTMTVIVHTCQEDYSNSAQLHLHGLMCMAWRARTASKEPA